MVSCFDDDDDDDDVLACACHQQSVYKAARCLCRCSCVRLATNVVNVADNQPDSDVLDRCQGGTVSDEPSTKRLRVPLDSALLQLRSSPAQSLHIHRGEHAWTSAHWRRPICSVKSQIPLPCPGRRQVRSWSQTFSELEFGLSSSSLAAS